jgi:hypothetical protein
MTAMMSGLKDLFERWIAAVAAAVHALATRVVPQRRILVVEGEANSFTARVTSAQKGPILPEMTFRLLHGRSRLSRRSGRKRCAAAASIFSCDPTECCSVRWIFPGRPAIFSTA